MEVFKLVDSEKIKLDGINLFESLNTHSGDTQVSTIVLAKTTEKAIKDLMLELSITDNDDVFKLKKDSTDDNYVYYYRALTNRTIKFSLKLKKDEGSIILKPNKNGLFYIEKNWLLDSEITIEIEIICDEYFSKDFGEAKTLNLSLEFFGDVDATEKTYM